MILMQGSHLARFFGSETLFDRVSIQVQNKSRIALVGKNGTGKSTLLKILAGIEASDAGQVTRNKGVTLSYLDQYAILDSDKTIYEEMESVFADVKELVRENQRLAELLGDEKVLADPEGYERVLEQFASNQAQVDNRNAYGYESEIKSVLNGFRFTSEDWDRPVNQLSGGQRTRLALARILLEKNDILILDEPTNHLDIETLTWLETYLQKYPGSLLIVSHDRYFLDKIATEVYELRNQEIFYYNGNYSYYLAERQLRMEQELAAYESQQEKIAKLEDYIARNLVRASTTKMAQSRRKQLEKMDRIDKPLSDDKAVSFRFSTENTSGQVVYQAEDLDVGYDGIKLSGPINLDLRRQQALAIVGPNGVGKSTFLKTITEAIPPVRGDQKLGANVSLGYYDQQFAHQNQSNTVLEELWSQYPGIPEKTIRTVLGNVLFSGDDVLKLVANLSGGEKARLEIAKLAMHHDNFLLLDEPTNHLDIDSKEVLEDALIHYDGTILFVSHDRYFINRIATTILELSPDGSKLYLGDYDYYIEKTAEEEELTRIALENSNATTGLTAKAVSENQQNFQMNKLRQKEVRALTRKIEALEVKLEEIEAEIEQIEMMLTQEKVFSDYEKSQEWHDKLEAQQAIQEQTLDEWETLSIELETLTAEN